MATKWHQHNIVPVHHPWNYLMGAGVENITVPPQPALIAATAPAYLESSHTPSQLCMCDQGFLCNGKNPPTLSTPKPHQTNGTGGGAGIHVTATSSAVVVGFGGDGDADIRTFSKQGWCGVSFP